MNTLRQKLIFAVFFLNCLALFFFGIVYVSSAKIMPYHQQVIGGTWENLTPKLQLLFISILKAAGTGFIVTAVSCFILLLIPFRKHQSWSFWTILLILNISNSSLTYITLNLALKTGVVTPWLFSLTGLLTTLLMVPVFITVKTNHKIQR
ncbi:MAG: hypothetical protein IT569_07110 [Leptospiraceae bacterium]|nr:hypothetical protein [Leptospiraceae bacterium]